MFTKATFKMTSLMGMEPISMLMEVSIRDSGFKARSRVLENIYLMMDLFYKAFSKKINSIN